MVSLVVDFGFYFYTNKKIEAMILKNELKKNLLPTPPKQAETKPNNCNSR